MSEKIDDSLQDKLDAATFRRFLHHLETHTDVQNIDLMILADFCRNCLGKWYMAEAKKEGIEVSYDEARERIYGMPYSEWKEKYQLPARQSNKRLLKRDKKKRQRQVTNIPSQIATTSTKKSGNAAFSLSPPDCTVTDIRQFYSPVQP